MFNPLSMVGNCSNVRVSAGYYNAAPSRLVIQSSRPPGNDITPSNFCCSAHDIATPEMPLDPQFVNIVDHSPFHNDLSTLQSQMYGASTDGVHPGNDFSDSIDCVYQKDTINPRNVPQPGFFGPFDNSLAGSTPRFITAIPGRTETWVQHSVGARFHTSGQKYPASAGDESSVPALLMGYPMLPPALLPGKDPHRITLQNVMNSEESEQINTPYKTGKHLFDASSPLLPENTWYFLSEKSPAAYTQCSPPFP